MNKKKYKLSRITDSPVYLIITIAVCIFVAETIAMLIIDALIHPLRLRDMFIDSVLLVVLISPALYFFVFRRFIIYITENRKSEQQIYRQAHILDTINKVFREALTCKTEKELANMCLALAEKLTGSQFGFFGEINKDGLLDTIAISNPGWDACKMSDSDALKLITNKKIHGPYGTALKSGISHIVNDLGSHQDRVGTPEGHPTLHSFMGVPLKLAGKTIGAIAMANKESGYNQDDQHAIETLSVAFVEALTSKRAELKLQDSEEKFRTITTTANDAIIMLDNGDCISFWNEAAERLFGFSRVEVMGGKLYEKIIPAGLRAAYIKGFKSFRDTGQGAVIGKTVEFTAMNKSGTEFPIELSLSSVKIDDKWNAVGIIRDITERKNMEKDNIKQIDFLNNVFESITNPLYVVNANDYTVEMANSSAYSGEFLQGTACYKLMHNVNTPCGAIDEQCPLNEVKRTKKPAVVEHVHYDNNDKPRFYNVHGYPVFDDQGNVKQMIEYSEDITDRKQSEVEIKQGIKKLKLALEGIINTLALTVEQRDPYTAGHQLRVSKLACVIADEMKLSEDQIEGLRMSGIVHDIGKMHIPTEILSRSGKLTEDEFNIVKSHAQVGYDILKGNQFPWPIADIVHQHHEHMDGSGYPLGLSDGDILMEARIICVADVVEAMASHRPYRPSLGMNVALEEILRRKGVHYDARVVKACLEIIKEKGFEFEQ